ncbi:MAG: glycoside hydrolase family 5 protein [Oscillospiraceae bacterium]|nr:glycoside hydrolase family 5 protein [Oscillospiraceae bacterium]
MKKLLSLLLAVVLLSSALAAPAALADAGTEELPAPSVYDDGRARPSSCGQLQVVDGKLCSESGEPVMLRGVSFNGLITSETFLNEPLFQELSRDHGVNLIRLAMYTYGVGAIGYCTKGDKDRHKQDIADGVNFARNQDMYVIIDWHILSDGDPNTYVDEALLFFAEMAETYADYNNVLYEICNEPNGVDWPTVKRYAEQVIPVIRERDPDSVIIVGNPDWSKDLASVAADPLDFENVLYTLHFYAATHGQDLRDITERLSQSGLPIFVSEYGVTASSGGFPRDLESADLWIELLEREHISYCMWAFSTAPEPCSALKRSVLKTHGFVEADFNDTGLWLLATLEKYNTR